MFLCLPLCCCCFCMLFLYSAFLNLILSWVPNCGTFARLCQCFVIAVFFSVNWALKWLFQASMILILAHAAHLSFIFYFINADKWVTVSYEVFLYHRQFLAETQTNPAQRPPELPVQSKFNSLFLCIILAKLLIIYWTILSNYQSSVGVIVGCEVQPPTVWLKWLFFPLPRFFGLKSSALNWSEPSGHRLRCSQNFNAPFSIV